jgi:hypothetical protein
MEMPEPKDDRKGTEPKDDRKGTEPKDDRKGEPSGFGAGGCGNDGAAMHILQSAAQLCGFLVVAVVAPMSGGGRAQTCSSDSSPRQVALSELRRRAEFKQRDAQFRPPSATPMPTVPKRPAPSAAPAGPSAGPAGPSAGPAGPSAGPAGPSAAPKPATPGGEPKSPSGGRETEPSKSAT